MTLSLHRNQTFLMFPGSLAGPDGSGVRCMEQPSGVAASYIATGTDTDTVACASAAATWVGYLVHFISGTSDNIGHYAVITKVSAGTSFEMWPAAPENVASGDQFEVLTNPMPIAVEDGGVDNSTTEIHDSTKTSWADDELNGYFAYCIHAEGSIAVGECRQITDHDLGTTISTVSAFSANVTDGDVFLICKPLAAEELGFETPQNMLERDPIRDAPAMEVKFPAERRPSVSFKIPWKSIGDPVGDGEDWTTKAKGASQLLLGELLGATAQDEGEVTTGAGTTTTRVIGTGTGDEQFTAGNAVVHNGEMSVISTITDGGAGDDTLNFVAAFGGGPLFSAAAAVGDTVHACHMSYMVTDGSQYPMSFLLFQDQIKKWAFSCAGNASIEASPNGRLMLAFSFSECQAWGADNTGIPTTLDDSHYPEIDVSDIRVHNSRVMFAASAIELTDVSIDLGIDLQPRPDVNVPEGSRGGLMLPGRPVATLSGYPLENKSMYDRVNQTALTGQLFMQFNTEAGNVVGAVFPRAQVVAVATDDGPIIRINLTVDGDRPDESDPIGDAVRLFHG